jgi:hypothetical protein
LRVLEAFTADQDTLRQYVGPGLVLSDDRPYLEYFRTFPEVSERPNVDALRSDVVRVARAETRPRPARFDTPAGLKPLKADLGNLARLEAFGTPENLMPGLWPVSLAWRALMETDESYAVTVQILDANGALVAQKDGLPVAGAAPTHDWRANEVILDRHFLNLPELRPGRYSLITALYNRESGERLAVGSSNHVVLARYDHP